MSADCRGLVEGILAVILGRLNGLDTYEGVVATGELVARILVDRLLILQSFVWVRWLIGGSLVLRGRLVIVFIRRLTMKVLIRFSGRSYGRCRRVWPLGSCRWR